MDSVEKYLKHLHDIRASGDATDETSYYTPLNNLFDEIGKELKPPVRCVLQLKNRGAGHPDGGLYTPDQFQKLSDQEPLAGQKPSRGAIEVKPTSDDAWVTADSGQVSKYWKQYGQVLITNYRDFLLLGRDSEGNPVKLASYRITPDEKTFWKATGHPQKVAREVGERFGEFLKLVMLSPAILSAPKDVAWVLAYYAREAKFRVEAQPGLSGLSTLREALEQALGIKFEGAKGEHFFRSTLVQTLFYGVFSAWVLWSKQHLPTSKDKFEWKLAQWSLRVPMIRALFEQLATPGKLGPLGLVEVLDWTAATLNRVDRASFFAAFQEQTAVQYFYEPFLEAFDPDLRKALGVWYTPLEVVQYMVARADAALRQELGVADGLADKNVYVLDAACGTGTYLVEVLKTILATLKAKGGALAAYYLKQAAMERVFGFEILPAPFVISHLQLGLLLQNVEAPLAEDGTERVAVYLTNSLTGWEPPKGPKQHLIFPEMEAERDAAGTVKQHPKILVVIGNPPYNAFAGVSPAEEEGLVEPYKKGLSTEWGIKKFNLDDLYIRFFRLAERRIAEKTGRGVVSYISNFSYLGDPSYTVMRQRFLSEFNRLWFDSMNGDSRETGKLTPDGRPDPSVFSTDANREGIRLGTAVSVMVKHGGPVTDPVVRYRDFWGATKRADLLHSLTSKDTDADYRIASPTKANRYSFRPSMVAADYEKWPKAVELCRENPVSGLQEMRKGALMGIDKNSLVSRMKDYLDAEIDFADVESSGLKMNGGAFNAKKARKKILKAEKFIENKIVRYALYPFDVRWAYHSNASLLWNRPRPSLAAQAWHGNTFFVVRMFAERPHENAPMTVSTVLPDYHLLRPNAVAIPFRVDYDLGPDDGHHGKITGRADAPSGIKANLSQACREYLQHLGIPDPDKDLASASSIWLHALAIGYAPFYLRENADGVRSDWPRIPLPRARDVLLDSAALGSELSQLLNTDVDVKSVTAGDIRPELSLIGNICAPAGGAVSPSKDFVITANWGHPGKGGVTMPGKGSLVERDYEPDEKTAIAKGAAMQGLDLNTAMVLLGDKTYDVYLNNRAYWKNIPSLVWEYTIGGYQVMKKWLSYRESEMLGRAIAAQEVDYFRDMARRVAAICLLQSQLDKNYTAVRSATYSWPTLVSKEVAAKDV